MKWLDCIIRSWRLKNILLLKKYLFASLFMPMCLICKTRKLSRLHHSMKSDPTYPQLQSVLTLLARKDFCLCTYVHTLLPCTDAVDAGSKGYESVNLFYAVSASQVADCKQHPIDGKTSVRPIGKQLGCDQTSAHSIRPSCQQLGCNQTSAHLLVFVMLQMTILWRRWPSFLQLAFQVL